MKTTSLYLAGLSGLLQISAALPFADGHGPSRFAIVNVDGSSEPSLPPPPPPPPPPAVTDTITTTIAQPITIQPYGPSPTETITVTAQPSISSRPANSSTASWSTFSSFSRNTTSSILSIPTSSILSIPTSSPCDWETTTSSTPSPTPTPTPFDCDDDDEDHGLSPKHHPPWYGKPTFVTSATGSAKPSYPASARAMLPSGMTAPLPVLPTEPPKYVNKTQIPYYRKRAMLDI